MLVSTRGRYALRFLVDLARNREAGYITVHELAERQEVSKKYAERLMAILSRGKFVETRHGAGGGYRLGIEPEECKVSDVLAAMSEELVPVEGVDYVKGDDNTEADATTVCEIEHEVDLLDAASKLIGIACLIITTISGVRALRRLN